jgi:hypothetical protein
VLGAVGFGIPLSAPRAGFFRVARKLDAVCGAVR